MGRIHDPARVMRERLRIIESRAARRDEARAVEAGIEESIALGQARGAAFERDSVSAGGPVRPYRRKPGLDWLAGKGRITAAQVAAGEAYGQAFRRAGASAAISSTLEVQPGGGTFSGPSPGLILKQAEGRRQALAQLERMRERLFRQSDLVTVCDQICGYELTPREAGGGDRESARLEAVLKVALDILRTA